MKWKSIDVFFFAKNVHFILWKVLLSWKRPLQWKKFIHASKVHFSRATQTARNVHFAPHTKIAHPFLRMAHFYQIKWMFFFSKFADKLPCRGPIWRWYSIYTKQNYSSHNISKTIRISRNARWIISRSCSRSSQWRTWSNAGPKTTILHRAVLYPLG